MKPVLTPAEASTLDRETQSRGVEAAVLMERAGRAVARSARELAGGSYGRRAVVVCGKGNNGGDGLVAARQLARQGVRTTVILLEDPRELREPAATNARRLEEVRGIRMRTFHQGSLHREVARADVIVDAIFGTGFRGMPEDDWAARDREPEPRPYTDRGRRHPLRGERDDGRGRGRGGARARDRDVRRGEARRGAAAGRRTRGCRPGGRHRLPGRSGPSTMRGSPSPRTSRRGSRHAIRTRTSAPRVSWSWWPGRAR